MAPTDNPRRVPGTGTPVDDQAGGDEKRGAIAGELAAYEDDIEADWDDVADAVDDVAPGDDGPADQAQREQDRQLESGEENPV